MGFVHNQIVAAVAKVSKENHGHLQSLIEDAISGKGGGGAGRKSRRKGSRRSRWLWCIGVLVLLGAAAAAAFFLLAAADRDIIAEFLVVDKRLPESSTPVGVESSAPADVESSTPVDVASSTAVDVES
ncbi:unnamed protein product, partial [Ectocarpus sp. 12 AP-2014]